MASSYASRFFGNHPIFSEIQTTDMTATLAGLVKKIPKLAERDGIKTIIIRRKIATMFMWCNINCFSYQNIENSDPLELDNGTKKIENGFNASSEWNAEAFRR